MSASVEIFRPLLALQTAHWADLSLAVDRSTGELAVTGGADAIDVCAPLLKPWAKDIAIALWFFDGQLDLLGEWMSQEAHERVERYQSIPNEEDGEFLDREITCREERALDARWRLRCGEREAEQEMQDHLDAWVIAKLRMRYLAEQLAKEVA
jgi:hypothetical protein